MKSTKPGQKSNTIVSSMLAIALLAMVALSCDVLQSDPDLKKPAVQIIGSQIYALSKGSTFIDLSSRIQANQSVTFTVTLQTRSGKLADLSNGLFQYSPNAGKGGTRDAFKFTVYGQNNNVLSQDSVVIMIADAQQLPCGIYPVDDSVHSVPKISPSEYQPVSVNVLANDILCNYDSSDIELSVYRPDPTYGPYHGTASAVYKPGHGALGFSIYYIPFSSFSGTDQFIYKIQSRSVPSNVAFGIVYIAAPDQCIFYLTDNSYTFSKDSIAQVVSGVQLPVFNDDVFCYGISNNQLHISSGPLFGSATISTNGVRYQTNPMSPGEKRIDSLQYEVCLPIPSTCLQAKIRITMQN